MEPVRTASDGSGEPVEDTADVVFAIASAKDADPSELTTPLHDVIDTDALDRLLRSGDEGTRVAFTYEDLRIEITCDGGISITRPPDER